MDEKKIGQVSHYFGNIGVGAIKLDQPLSVGDTIHIKGANTDFTQTVESLQINKEGIEQANAGEEVGLKVKEAVREGDSVYLVVAE